MLVKNIFKIHFKLYMQVCYWLKYFWNPYLGKYLNFQASDSVEYCLKAFHWIFCLFIILTRLQTAFYMSSFWHLTFRANFGACKVAPNGERRKLANEQAGESLDYLEGRAFIIKWQPLIMKAFAKYILKMLLIVWIFKKIISIG
jgi:hypothetical protein